MKKKNTKGLLFAIAIVVVLVGASIFWYKKMPDGRTRLEHWLYYYNKPSSTQVLKVIK